MMLHAYHPLAICQPNISTSYTLQFPRYSLDKILRSRSLWQDQRSNQGHTMTLHDPQPMSLPSSGVNGKPVYRILFRLGRNDEIRKEYLSTVN